MLNRVKHFFKRQKLKKLYRTKSFIEAYREHTDIRVEDDPHAAVGGMWEEIGKMQLSFLKSKGLEPQHTLLDLGCGTLRAGRHFGPYLNAENYTGVDVSPKAIEFSRNLVEEEGLSEKQPTLILNAAGDLKFDNIDGKFDYMIAQSVFTHLPESLIFECFDNLHKVLKGTFYFTIFSGEREQLREKTFQYPIEWFRETVESRGYVFQDCSADLNHPRKQVMLSATPR